MRKSIGWHTDEFLFYSNFDWSLSWETLIKSKLIITSRKIMSLKRNNVNSFKSQKSEANKKFGKI